MNLHEKIPNNVNLHENRRLQREWDPKTQAASQQLDGDTREKTLGRVDFEGSLRRAGVVGKQQKLLTEALELPHRNLDLSALLAWKAAGDKEFRKYAGLHRSRRDWKTESILFRNFASVK